MLSKFVATYVKGTEDDLLDGKKSSDNIEPYIRGEERMRFVSADSHDEKNKFIVVVNGREAWSKYNDQPASDISDTLDSWREAVYSEWATMLVPLLHDEFRLSILDEITVAGHKAEGIRIAHDKHGPLKFYFDKDTHLLVKRQRTRKKLGAVYEGTEETVWSDFHEVQGTKQAMKDLVLFDGVAASQGETTELKFFEKPLDEKLFAKP